MNHTTHGGNGASPNAGHVVQLEPGHTGARERPQSAEKAKAKSGRTRYVRFFPERLSWVLSRFTAQEAVAYLRVALEFVVRDGELLDDERKLAAIAGLKRGAWLALREQLLVLGICELEDGRFVDSDQQQNLEFQRAASKRQADRARAGWEKRNARG